MTEKVLRDWGEWEVIRQEPGFKIKKLIINPGKSISLQYHEHRSEVWCFIKGQGSIRLEDTIMEVSEGSVEYVPVGAIHKITNNGIDPLVIVEIQQGEICEENDIIRLPEENVI